MLKNVKEWRDVARDFLKAWSKKVRWFADMVDWAATTLDGLPLPEDDTEVRNTENPKP